MKIGLAFLMGSIALANSVQAEEGLGIESDIRFCIQTLNTYGPFYASKRHVRTQALLKELSEQTLCDLNQFQEVWLEGPLKEFSEGFNQIDPRSQFRVFDEIRDDGWRSGVATVTSGWSQFEFVRTNARLFTLDRRSFFDRIRGWTKVWKGFGVVFGNWKGQEALASVNLHLHPTEQAIRIGQLVELAQWMETDLKPHHSVIWAGDFNFVPESLEWLFVTKYLGFRDAFQHVHGNYTGMTCTYCTSNPLSWTWNTSRTLDYVFYRSGTNLELMPNTAEINLTQRAGVYFSDHYGVRVQFGAAVGPHESPKSTDAEEKRKILTGMIKTLEQKGNVEDIQKGIESALRQLRIWLSRI